MTVRIMVGDVRATLREVADGTVHTVVTSPPYFGLRDYGHAGQIGLEPSPEAYVAELVEVFREVRRVLRDDGTLWLNLGDSYANDAKWGGASGGKHVEALHGDTNVGRGKKETGLKAKDLIGIPWRVAFALQQPWLTCRGCGAEHHASARGVPVDTGGSTNGAVAGSVPWEGVTRNKRTVWTVPTRPFKGAHFATFPPDLIEPCILAGAPPAGRRCDCLDVIETPAGEGERAGDPSRLTGRAGMDRPRRDVEATRPITRAQQRHDAAIAASSPHRAEMEARCGDAFAHYVRTDRAGARPFPPAIRAEFAALGWLTDAPPCACPEHPPGIVLDPFGGAGTTGLVADRLGRDAILCELNPEYAQMARERITGDAPLLADVTA